VRCPRAELRSAPGRPWASCRSPLRAIGGVLPLDWDRAGRVTPVATGFILPQRGNQGANTPSTSQEAWPEAEPLGMEDSPGKNRGGTPTGERARSGGSAQAGTLVARTAPAGADMKHCGCRRSASFLFFRSFFRSSLSFQFVIAGLDPAIHAEAKLDRIFRSGSASRTLAWTAES
jgi:hypothetical protein